MTGPARAAARRALTQRWQAAWRTTLAAWAALVAPLVLGGCAALMPADTPPPAADPGSPTTTTTTADGAETVGVRWRVRVEAPGNLAALLQQHLDIARLPALAGDEMVPEAELSRLLDATPAQARTLLQTEGFFDPTVRLVRAGDRIRVVVDPGRQTRVGRVDIDIVGAAAEDADRGDPVARAVLQGLRSGWPMPRGAAFRNGDWSAAKAGLLAGLRDAGYAAASWLGTAAEVAPEDTSARLFVVADSGPLFRAGPLQIEGLQHHEASTVRHIAGFRPGQPLTQALLLDFQDRLRQAGLYDRIDVGFDPDPQTADAAPVRVRLGEAPRQVWTLGLGYSATVGPRASAEHLHRRLFGWQLVSRNKVEWARLRQAWDGEISTHPGERLWRWLVGGAVERLESDDDIVLSQRLRAGRAQNSTRTDRLLFVEAERSSRRNQVQRGAASDSTEMAISGNLHGVWRRLDDPLLPTRGWSLSLQGGVGRAHGSDSDSGWFSRAYGRLTLYQPLPADWYAQARLELGQVFRPDGVAVPDSQQFRAGGDDSVRGYAYRSLGPVVDGAVDSADALATVSLELARPVSRRLPSVWGAVFVDAGNAANDFGHLTPAVGAGVGVRWRSPVGPLKLDWAYGRELRKSRLHFSVGVTF
ncbi:autotransporter assembly complex protein TamA [Rubrivivax albus]|uniref:Outer membrane protein assembly factor n=1 Tax=Rubrivivax albus TaxID=2499835 RepID=A0A3S2U523_9BURK|nr:BamA/TamA family outer membrane protein [Rubrivivax albus]RVT53828.1 outer membrane protein assembly factor [Rubrivivax albus]